MAGVSIRLYWWQIGIAIVSAIALYSNSTVAQVTPDTTLPNNSQVTLSDKTFNITGGSTVGGNLFHSFQDFSIPTGSGATFNNAIEIQNIITRVTGKSISNIDGLIKANGAANLFFINPNGIIFGENAKLEIGGSFIGSTANAIGFGNLGTFSATNPLAPTPLLTINPSALLFSQIQASKIESNSVAPSGNDPSNAFTAQGLRVLDGKSLLLVGGDISINGGGLVTYGGLYAFGGRIELGGLAGVGTVGLNEDGDNFSLSFPPEVNKSDVFLSDSARVNVRAGNGGSITINARNLEMTGSSAILAGVQSGLGTDNTQARNIDINATEAILLTNSYIFNDVEANAIGQGGDVSIKTNALRLEDGGQVGANTFSVGRGGNLKIDATSKVELLGANTNDGFLSGFFVTQATKDAIGNAGNLTIKTPILKVWDGAVVSTTTFGAGQGGDVKIDAGTIEVTGTLSSSSVSRIITQAEQNATGAAGDLTIKTNQLLVQDGQISASTFGTSPGGNLKIDAISSIELLGINTIGNDSASGLFVAQLTEGATGNAGNLTINTPVLRVLNGAEISAGTHGMGRGGDLKIDAANIEVVGTSSKGSNSRIAVKAEQNAKGAAGDLIIKTDKLLAQNGGIVSASTDGAGDGGNLKIDAASSVKLFGVNPFISPSPSGLFAMQNTIDATGNAGSLTVNTPVLQVFDGAYISTSTSGVGRAGDLMIKTDYLSVKNGGQVVAGTQGAGQGGNLTIDATSSVELFSVNPLDSNFRSGLFIQQNSKDGTGNVGNLTINTPVLRVLDGAVINAGTLGIGRGGELKINAGIIEVIGTSTNGSAGGIFTQADPTAIGAAGDLTIMTDKLLVQNGGQISASTLGASQGGNLKINATSSIELKSVSIVNSNSPSGLFVIQGTEDGRGAAGNLAINTNQLRVFDGAAIAVLSYGTGTAGNLTISANSINLDKNALLTADTRSNRTDITQATININSRDLILRRNSSITTNATGSLVIGGDININTDVLGAFENSKITANSANFRGGNINIKTQGLFKNPDSAITASGATSALSGNVLITTLTDPSRGLVEIPINLVDASRQISNACTPGNPGFENTFTVTGRGGLPISPTEALQEQNIYSVWVRFKGQPGANTVRINQPYKATKAPTIREASSWIADKSGNIELVAPASQAPQTPHSVSCSVLNQN